MRGHKKLCLIGGMGSGKSSLSRRYGALVGGSIIDTDKEFTRRYGEISGFFERFGEKEFRKREEELMIEAANSDASVIATGGGAVLNKRGMYALRAACDIVYLTAPIEVLRKRIMHSDRPLRHDFDKVMVEREPLYRKYADYIIDTSDDSLRELMLALKKPRKLRYDIVLCDSDETLLDFNASYAFALKNTFVSLGVTVDRNSAIKIYREITDEVWGKLERGEITRKELEAMRAEMLASRLGVNFAPKDFNDVYVSEMQKTRFVIDGAIEFCDRVRATSAKLFVITNSFERIAKERLKALDGHIDGFFISETVGFNKPDVRFFDAVLKCIGDGDKSRMIVFGDSETSDIKGGADSGLDTCLFDRAEKHKDVETKADYHVKSYDEFFKLL